MSREQIDIADMQCWVFRMAQEKWKLSAQECLSVFEKYDIFRYLSECYDLLHLSGYSCALDDVEHYLSMRGENL